MEKKFDVIGVENLIMDFAVAINRIPETDSASQLKDFLWQSGGNASSAIVAAARLGSKCAMLGQCGTDEFGKFCKDDMVRHGVDISHIYTREGVTTFSICLAEEETQGRSFLIRGGVNEPLTDEEVGEDFIASSRYIHTGVFANSAQQAAVRFAKKNGVLVSVDAGGYRDAESHKLIHDTDLWVMSEMYYEALFGDSTDYEKNCASLLNEGPSMVVVTLGKIGCAGADKNGTFSLPPFSGYKIVDTTGAGDVFHGGFVYAHSQGWDIERCAKFASAVSYINCTSLGGRVGIPNRKMVDEFLETGKIDYTDIEPRREFYRNVMQFRR